MATKEVNPQVEATPEDAERIGTLGAVLGNNTPLPEVTVGPVNVGGSPVGEPLYRVRVNESVDEMSLVAGGKRHQFKFEVGHEYFVPFDVATELERCGRLYH